MGQFEVKIEELAEKHLKQHFKSGDKASIKKIEKILIELSQTPYNGTGNPEPLRYELSGFWSRRINQKDRIIYKVEEHIVTVFVISAMGTTIKNNATQLCFNLTCSKIRSPCN